MLGHILYRSGWPFAALPPAMGDAMSYQGAWTPTLARLVRRDTGTEVPLSGDLVRLGRGTQNQVIINDPRASTNHALIQRIGDGYWLEDQGSANGTLINGQRLMQRTLLRHGDEIQIGQSRFQFLAVPAQAAAPAPYAPPPPPSAFAPPASFAPPVFSPAPPPPPSFAPPPPPPAFGAPPVAGGHPGPSLGHDAIGAFAPPPGVPLPPLGGAAGVAPPIAPVAAIARRVLLRVTAGPAMGRSYVVGEQGAILGRAAENVVAIPDDRLSRRHAQITFNPSGYWLNDLGSTNGTYVRGLRLTAPQLLRSGDEIALGETRIAITLEM
jgi:pSer/pThr/pTyr-binding forkhead associated (FHA) protein